MYNKRCSYFSFFHKKSNSTFNEGEEKRGQNVTEIRRIKDNDSIDGAIVPVLNPLKPSGKYISRLIFNNQ
jgi:hypothetical protein